MSGIDQWWEDGERIPLWLGMAERMVFVRRMGSGPMVTLLHGFPSSSYDWARVAEDLGRDHTLLLPDFLGFGASDKPGEHDYSIHEQADLVQAAWQHFQVGEMALVAHDYGSTVAQELLARRADGSLGVGLTAVTLANAGLYPDMHRPVPMQTALADPVQGPQVSAAVTEELLAAALDSSYGEGYDGSADSHDIWRSMERDDGVRLMHKLIAYMADRRRHEQRWVGALQDTDVPLSFVWGMQDPISGAHMAERIRERLPDAPFVALDDVGHWPPLEAPERVVAAVRG